MNYTGLFVASAVFLAPLITVTLIHEQRHVSISENMGCEAEIKILPEKHKALIGTETDCTDTDLSKKQTLHLHTRHSQVETIGYQLLPLVLLMSFIIYLQIQQVKRK